MPKTTQTSKSFNKIRLVNNIVTLVDGLRLVTSDGMGTRSESSLRPHPNRRSDSPTDQKKRRE